MDSVYQATFFLALTLLAVLVPVFVFAVSFLGRAIERAREEEESIRREHEQKMKEEIREAQSEFKEATTKGGSVQQVKEHLDKLLKEEKRYHKETKKARKGFVRLTVRGAVIYPGFLLLVTLVLAVFARYLGNLSANSAQVSVAGLLVWGAGLVALLFSLNLILRSLASVQKVALTSEAAYFLRMKDALKEALMEHEEARQPQLILSFKEQLPIRLNAGSEQEIKYLVKLIKGDLAINAEVWFFAPDGFRFPGKEWRLPSDDRFYPNFVKTEITPEKVLKWGINYMYNLSIVTPVEAGEYTLGYSLYCEQFALQNQRFNILVTEVDEDIPF